ncbi:hypothetical protein OF829_10365 [Sphingomonas sp. LB-2]|uniref:hypothetical protein n=1 Tax=Sphingomonas caeni TaxID=2984949 RepID=UPI0022324BCE|nr:hypothetical protein [Sphingomonas caeni]MCW3847647.1 hypothetical protein [Sphingomonas caeni]
MAAACLFAAAPAAAQGAARDWSLQIDPAMCTLNRTVTEPTPHMIGLWTRPGSDYFTLVIAERGLPDLGGRYPVPATVQFAADGPVHKGYVGVFPVHAQGIHGVTVTGMRPAFLEAFAGASALTVTIGSKSFGPYLLPSAGPAVRAFKGCVADQLIEWGADPAQFAKGGAPAVALVPIDDWIPNRQLIFMAGNAHFFHAAFRVTATPEGVVDGCQIIDPETDKRAEKIGCDAVMNRKLLTPGRDPQGQPVRGAATFEVELQRRPAMR